MIDIFGVGAGRDALPSHDRRDMVDITLLVARRSALADLSTICVTIASRLVSLRRRPSIVTTTVSFSASASNAGRLLTLRPPGLPGCPFWKRVCSGGRPAHLVTAVAVRHRSPPRYFGACIYSAYVLICQILACAYSNNKTGAKCRQEFSLQPPSAALDASLLPEPCFGHLTI